MVADFYGSAKKANQEYHLNNLLQQGILWSSWGPPHQLCKAPPLLSCPPPTPTSAGDPSSHFPEKIKTKERIPLTLLTYLHVYLLYGFLMSFPFTSVEDYALLHQRLILPGEFLQLQGSGSVKYLSLMCSFSTASFLLFPFSLYSYSSFFNLNNSSSNTTHMHLLQLLSSFLFIREAATTPSILSQHERHWPEERTLLQSECSCDEGCIITPTSTYFFFLIL